jgi:DNA-binding response OmpR family regulator
MSLDPGRISRAAIHCAAGEAELRLTAAGNWQLALRAEGAREWSLACSGDLSNGAVGPHVAPRRATRIGQLVVDTEARAVFACGREVQASRLEFSLLATLAADPTRVFSKWELLQIVWGDRNRSRTRTLDSHASRMRVKLRRAGAPGFIINVQRAGYKLCDGLPLVAGD